MEVTFLRVFYELDVNVNNLIFYKKIVYQAANHRVKHVNVERVSVPFFTELGYDSLIESFTPEKPEEPIKYDPIIYGEYITMSNKNFKEYRR